MPEVFLFLARCRKGGTVVEYALLAAGIAAACLGAMFFFSDNLALVFQTIGNAFDFSG